jgi:hypothetical protein
LSWSVFGTLQVGLLIRYQAVIVIAANALNPWKEFIFLACLIGGWTESLDHWGKAFA